MLSQFSDLAILRGGFLRWLRPIRRLQLLFGIDDFGIIDVVGIAALDTNAITGIVDIHQPIPIDDGF